MNHNTAKKIGRRGAQTYGRPGTPQLKRAASKAVRKHPINETQCNELFSLTKEDKPGM